MDTTPVSLLQRLRETGATDDWRSLTELCTPLLYAWVKRSGISGDEAGDLVQDVLVVLLETLPTWEYDGTRSFRAWLKTVTLNRCREHWRKKSPRQVEGPEPPWDKLAGDNDPADLFSEEQFCAYIAQRALEIMQARFEPRTWQACWRHAVEGKSAAEVARGLGMTEGAVYAAKCRVMKTLREELEGLWE